MHSIASLHVLRARVRSALIVLVLLAVSAPPLALPAAADTNPVVIGALNADRMGGSSFFTNPEYSRVHEYLNLGFDFSTALGTVERDVSYKTNIATVTPQSLAGVDVFIALVDEPYTADEVAALQAFNDAGGALILAADGGATPLLDTYATVSCGTTKGDGPLTGTITNATHPIANGLFGTVSTYEQWFTLGCITTPANGTEVGVNPAGSWAGASIVTIEPGDGASPTGGPVVLLGDISIMTASSSHDAAEVNGVLIKNLFAYVFAGSTTYLPPEDDVFVLGALSTIRTGTSSGFFGDPGFGGTLELLGNPLNFGAPGAPVPETIGFDTTIETITPAALAGVDAFFLTSHLAIGSVEERAALQDFNDAGGALIITADAPTVTVADLFTTPGCGMFKNDGALLGNITDADHPVANGLFGTVTTFEQWSAIGCFPSPPASATVVGTNPAGDWAGAAIVVIEPGTGAPPTSGPVVLISDHDVFRNQSGVHAAASVNATLIKNVFAYVMGYGGTGPVDPPPDTTPPVIGSTLTPPTPDGDDDWYRSDVSLDWVATEAESPSSLLLTGCDDQAITADQATADYTCSASSEGGDAGPVTVSIKRDATAPTVTCATPAPTFARDAAGSVSAAVSDNLSGPASATATATADTSAVGSFTSEVTGYDNAGNQAVAVCPYNVVFSYAFGGFLSPVNALPTRNVVKAGRAIPVKFRLGGNQGLAIFGGAEAQHPAIDGPVSSNASCSPGGTDTIEQTATAGSSGLTYDAATDTYTYVWKTASSWGGKCRVFELNLDDGSDQRIEFQFTR